MLIEGRAEVMRIVLAVLVAVTVCVHGDEAGQVAVAGRAGPVQREVGDTAYLFTDGVYVAPPHVVESRETDIFVNDILVEKGMGWLPTFVPLGNEQDPGPPPVGCSPCMRDPGVAREDWYWEKRLRYESMLGPTNVAERMFEAVKASPEIVQAKWLNGDILMTDKAGLTRRKEYGDVPIVLSREEEEARAERKRKSFERHLRSDIVQLSWSIGMSMTLSGSRGELFLDLLLSHATPEERVKLLHEANFSFYEGDTTISDFARPFRASPELRKRVAEDKERERDEGIAAVDLSGEEADWHAYIFADGVYVAPPYVVESRETDIFVNDVCVGRGPGLPGPPAVREEDPGPPPVGLSPCEPEPGAGPGESYWARRARYERQFGAGLSERMFEALKASPQVAHVELGGNVVRITDNAGRTHIVLYEDERRVRSREEVEAEVERLRKRTEEGLRSGKVLLLYGDGGGMRLGLFGKSGFEFLDLLVSDMTPEERDKLLEERQFYFYRGDTTIRDFARTFRASPELKRRIAEDKKRRRLEALPERVERTKKDP